MTAFNKIPLELHLCIMEYLSSNDMKSLSQTSQEFRSIYRGETFRHILIFRPKKNSRGTRELFNPKYRLVSANAFFKCIRFSWFLPNEVFHIHFLKESLDLAMDDPYIAHVTQRIIIVNFPNVKTVTFSLKTKAPFLRHSTSTLPDFFSTFLIDVPSIDLKAVHCDNFLKIFPEIHFPRIKTLEIRSWDEVFVKEIRFELMESLERFSFCAPPNITFERYQTLITELSKVPKLKEVWTTHVLSQDHTWKLVSLLPKNLDRCEVSIYYPELDPLMAMSPSNEKIDLSAVTHLNILLENKNLPLDIPNRSISNLRLNNLKSMRIRGPNVDQLLKICQTNAGKSSLTDLNLYIEEDYKSGTLSTLEMNTDFTANLKYLMISLWNFENKLSPFSNQPKKKLNRTVNIYNTLVLFILKHENLLRRINAKNLTNYKNRNNNVGSMEDTSQNQAQAQAQTADNNTSNQNVSTTTTTPSAVDSDLTTSEPPTQVTNDTEISASENGHSQLQRSSSNTSLHSEATAIPNEDKRNSQDENKNKDDKLDISKEELTELIKLHIPKSKNWGILLEVLLDFFLAPNPEYLLNNYEDVDTPMVKGHSSLIYMMLHRNMEFLIKTISNLKNLEYLGLFRAVNVLNCLQFHQMIQDNPKLKQVVFTEKIDNLEFFSNDSDLDFPSYIRPISLPDVHGTRNLAVTNLLDVDGLRFKYQKSIFKNEDLEYYEKQARHRVNLKEPTIRQSFFENSISHYHRWLWKQ